jgi:hypothetical protein
MSRGQLFALHNESLKKEKAVFTNLKPTYSENSCTLFNLNEVAQMIKGKFKFVLEVNRLSAIVVLSIVQRAIKGLMSDRGMKPEGGTDS